MYSLENRKWDTAKYLFSIGGHSIDWEFKTREARSYGVNGGLIHFICKWLLNSSECDLLKGLLNAIPKKNRNAIANQRGYVCLCLICFLIFDCNCVCIVFVFVS